MYKGDCILGPFLVDIKEYDESFSVSRKNWAKLQSDAIQNKRRQPMFFLVLGEEGKQPVRLMVVAENMGKEMLEAWEEKYGEDV